MAAAATAVAGDVVALVALLLVLLVLISELLHHVRFDAAFALDVIEPAAEGAWAPAVRLHSYHQSHPVLLSNLAVHQALALLGDVVQLLVGRIGLDEQVDFVTQLLGQRTQEDQSEGVVQVALVFCSHFFGEGTLVEHLEVVRKDGDIHVWLHLHCIQMHEHLEGEGFCSELSAHCLDVDGPRGGGVDALQVFQCLALSSFLK